MVEICTSVGAFYLFIDIINTGAKLLESFFIISIDNGQPRFQGEFPVFQYDTMLENEKTLGTRLGHNYEKAIVAPRVLETTLDCLFGFT